MATARKRPSEFSGACSSAILLLIMPFVAYVHYHGYALLSAEILYSVAMLALVGLCLAVLIAQTTGLIQGLVLAVIITVAVDLCLQGESQVVLLCAFVLALLLIMLVRQQAKFLISAMCLAALSANALVPSGETLALEEGPDTVVQTELPPVIHLILDEYMGLEALPGGVDGNLRNDTIAFFANSGFEVAGGAYSQYFTTYNSIGNTLNYASSNVDAWPYLEAQEPYTLSSSAYFDQLAGQGYRFRIYQSSFLDYCRVPNIDYRSCSTYAAESIKYIESLQIPAHEKAGFILSDFWRLSALRATFRAAYNRALAASGWLGRSLPFWRNRITTFGPLPAFGVFERLAEDVSSSPGGEVFFAHLLIPHSAYILDHDCAVRADTRLWRTRLITEHASDRPNTDDSRMLTYAAYTRQLRCTNRLLGDFFAKLKTSGQFARSTIVIHGDHGSRINLSWPTKANLEYLVDSDFTDGFPTLFAVKSPGTLAGYSSARRTLSALLAETMGVQGPDDPRVFLYAGSGQPLLSQPMPAAWMAEKSLSSAR